MVPARRVRLAEVAEAFLPSPTWVQRVSLALWDESERPGFREPVIVHGATGPTTLVLVWPTDERGMLIGRALDAGEVRIMRWDLTPGAIAELRRRSEAWPLDLHDLRVKGTPEIPRCFPCPESLRAAPLGLDLDRRIENAARLLTS